MVHGICGLQMVLFVTAVTVAVSLVMQALALYSTGKVVLMHTVRACRGV
jgi:hypothetical protein